MALLPPTRIQERGSDRANGYRDYVPQWVDREEEGSSGRMEEDTELEEGEAFEGGGSASGSGDDDLERLSYLDTRLESVLGDCQKEFQGNLSTERLGSRYGGYGSFLPTTIRAAPVLGPSPPPPSGSEVARPRPAEGQVGALRPRPTEGSVERARRGQSGASVVTTADPNSWSKAREPSQKKKHVKSINAMLKSEAPGATNSVKETGPAEKKGLTVRLQLPPKQSSQGLDKHAQNSVYNKFGLDHPSSGSDDDLDEEEKSGSDDNTSPDLSPNRMIQVMTAFEPPYGGMLSPLIPALVPSEPSERKDLSKHIMNTPASKTEGVQGSKKSGFMESQNKVSKETKTKQKEVIVPPEIVKAVLPIEPLKSGKKEVKEGSINSLKVSYKHPVPREEPIPQSKPPSEPKKKIKDNSKEYSAPKEQKEKVRDAKESVKEAKKELDRKEPPSMAQVDVGREVPKETFKVTLKDMPPSKEQLKPAQRDSLDVKAGKKVKKAGKEPAKSQSKDGEKEKGVYTVSVVQADVNGFQDPAPQGFLPPAVGTSNPENPVPLDNWVECTKCRQWRLALPGVNVDLLPDDWQCTAMTWLPGLNKCKYTEETTTAAVKSYLGLSNPDTVPVDAALGVPPVLLLPASLPPVDLAHENRQLEQKPFKLQKSSSKKAGSTKKTGGTTPKLSAPTAKKVDSGGPKNKNLSDVGQPIERGPAVLGEDSGYQRVMADKQRLKEKEKLKRMRVDEGEDTRPPKQAVREERHKISSGVKRKKKSELSEDNNAIQVAKQAKMADYVERKGAVDTFVQSRGQSSDENTHSLNYGSDDAGISSRNAGRSSLPAQAPKKMKVTLSGRMDAKRKEDKLDAKGDDRKRNEIQRRANVKCKPEYFDKHEGTDSDDDKPHRDDYRNSYKFSESSRKAVSRGRNGYIDGKKRAKEEGESAYYIEKRRMLPNDLETAREFNSGSSPKSPRDGFDDEWRADGAFREKRLFDEVSGIARTYAQGSFGDRADDSPHGQSPARNVDRHSQDQPRGEKRSRRRSRSHSPAASSSYSRGSSATGYKAASPIESTVSSSPLRSLKAVNGAKARRMTDSVQANDHIATADSHPTSNKQSPVSPSPKRSADEPDPRSDRGGQPRQAHRGWDDRGHSPEPERDARGSGRDGNNRDTSSGRDRYARSNSREEGPPDVRKYDGKSRGSGRDDDRHWEEGGNRERRASTVSQFSNGDRHRDDRHRERDEKYDRRTEDRLRDRDRDRDRERPRDTWTTDRPGDHREERSARERSSHQRDDWNARPSSRESRLDKQDPRSSRDTRGGRERAEDGGADKLNIDSRSKHVDDSKDEPCHDEHEPVQAVQRDSSSHRHDNNESTSHKDSKSRANVMSERNGDRPGAVPSVRKETEGGAVRSGTDPVSAAAAGKSRSRPEGHVPSAQKKSSSPAPETRHADENPRQGKEPKNGSEGGYLLRIGAEVGHGSNPGHIARGSEGGSSSPTKKTNHALLSTSLTKEAKSLKHSADRIKNVTGMEDESTNMYLQAGLKFLEGAHHQEAANERPADCPVIFRIYLDTANLCDYCSSAFEKNKDHAAAALSYMVAAVARMRVLMLKYKDLGKDCMELQHAVKSSTALGSQAAAVLTPPIGVASVPQLNRVSASQPGAPIIGESPSSSSASDLDNLNNHAALNEKLASNISKGVASSPLPGNSAGTVEVLPSRLHANYQRLLTNSTDVFRMLESLNRARAATAAYQAECAGDESRQESILAIRRVGEIGLLDDMEALVKQVRKALHAIGH
ncbi:hypothetical protein R1flu_024442 [Riccia fluitans]|uniref:CW-type domain-containing protein n=1 Tax=Riccia fluitans TaxID=41844 RepID=A0ABD1XUX5_9MARC